MFTSPLIYPISEFDNTRTVKCRHLTMWPRWLGWWAAGR